MKLSPESATIVSTVLMGREKSRDLRRHTRATRVLCVRTGFCFAAMLFCDDTVTKGRCYESIVSKVLMGRDASRDLMSQLLPYYLKWGDFGALFCGDTIARGRYRSISKVGGERSDWSTVQWRHLIKCEYNCQLGLGLVTVIEKVDKKL